MKVYIAGRISGVPDYWGPFVLAEQKLEDQGYVVLNPARLPEGMSKADYMRICFAMIDRADIVAMRPGWETSTGARLEADYCQYIGKPVNSLDNILREIVEEEEHGTTERHSD